MPETPEAENKDLINRAVRGDADAFEDLVNNYYEVMFKMAYKWCTNQRDAEDITQEACIKLARGIASYKADSKFTSWLYRLVINTAKDWYKSQNRHPDSTELIETFAAEDSKPDEKIYVNQVWEQVHKLPEAEKESLLLVIGQGLSHKEAAQISGVKESTISWRIHEARKKLQAIFGKEQNYG
ncbi:MAG: RNA polymerase subunit sigma-24 [Zetaproteobacteria bacterium]|nr:MAG: RNA polymerase subunit sigma-24 [Zetaproteobacteria bacterium]